MDMDRVERLSEEEQAVVQEIQYQAKKGALRTVALFPLVMLVCYLGLALSMSIGVDVVFMLLIASLEGLFGRIKGVNVVYGRRPDGSGDHA